MGGCLSGNINGVLAGVDWQLKRVIEAMPKYLTWPVLLVNLSADDRHIWIGQFVEAAHEFGERHC